MHVAIADRRQRLDRKIKQIEKSPSGGVGDRMIAERKEPGKYGIEHDEDQCSAGEKHRPANGHRAMVEVGPEALAQTEGLHLAVADPDELKFVRLRLAPRFCHRDLVDPMRS